MARPLTDPRGPLERVNSKLVRVEIDQIRSDAEARGSTFSGEIRRHVQLGLSPAGRALHRIVELRGGEAIAEQLQKLVAKLEQENPDG